MISRDSAAAKGTRADREARALFAVALAREKAPSPCEYGIAWASDQIPDYVGRRAFHLTVRAGLAPPSEVGDFVATLDPEHRRPEAFCSDDALKAYSAKRIREFETGSDKHLFVVDRTTFTYPVFDRDYSLAVVVHSSLGLEGRSRLLGKIIRHAASGYCEADVYRKRHGRWRFVRSIFIYTT